MKKNYKDIVPDYELWFNYVNNFKNENYKYSKNNFLERKRNSEEILDLHGLTLEESYNIVKEFLITSKTRNITKIIVITGKSGIIRKEFPLWLENFKEKKLIINYKKINDGSFQLKIMKTCHSSVC